MMEAGERYWAVLESAWGLIDIYESPRDFSETYAAVPLVQRTLFAVHFCQSEVRNGGLHQFFTNPSGVLAPEAVQGFERIGMHDTATILRKAMAFFGIPYPRGQAKRTRMLETRTGRTREQWDPFYQLDRRFYTALSSESGGFEKAADLYADSGRTIGDEDDPTMR